jgi:hypothetical protein
MLMTRLSRDLGLLPLIALVVFGLASMGATPPPPEPDVDYGSDELIVEFYVDPTDHELEVFEVKYRLAFDHRFPSERPSYLFDILDGLDARLKRTFVADDPSVCRVTLNWAGEFFATEPERPFGRCEGDDVGLPWPDPSQSPSAKDEATPIPTPDASTGTELSPATAATPPSSSPQAPGVMGPEPDGGSASLSLATGVWLAIGLGGLLLAAGVAWRVGARRLTRP